MSACNLARETMDKVPRQLVALSRLMSPQYANIRGFIHGGSLMRLMEEAGFVAATRQINVPFAFAVTSTTTPSFVRLGALARIEQLDFLAPVEVGDVVEIKGGVDFVTRHSCRVSLQVSTVRAVRDPTSVNETSEKTGTKSLTNQAKLWYVPLQVEDGTGIRQVIEMPNVDLSNVEPSILKAANASYSARKDCDKKKCQNVVEKWSATDLLRMQPVVNDLLSRTEPTASNPGTVDWTRSSTSCLVDHNHCDLAGNASGGALLKMADEVAALAAAKHSMAGTPTTAQMDAIDFQKIIPKGSFVRLESRVTYASQKSCQVSVVGHAVNLYAPNGPEAIPDALKANLTFVAFDRKGSLVSMPSLQPLTQEQIRDYEVAKSQHEVKKMERQRLQ